MDKMSCLKKMFTRRSDDDLEEDSEDKDSKRKSRNLSEKKRRDQFNLLVNELNTIVSTAGGCKMDKSTVLKATISFLKNHNAVAVRSRAHEIQENWKPNCLTNEEFTHLILEAVDGFLVVLDNAGSILYISESVTSLLGYIPDDIVGMTIYDLGCADEQNDLCNILAGQSIEEVSFSCHLRRANYGQRQHFIYDLIHFIGYFRTNTETDSSRQPACSANKESRLVFIGTGRLQVPQLINEIHFIHPPAKIEFTSRHSFEWKFLYLDHRAPSIIGYLPFELLGTSGYDYYHIDDMDGVVGSHAALMQKGEGTSCYYRFLTKGQQWIWLQTRYYITYHQWNSKPELIVCIHRVISHVDVIKNAIKDDTSNRLLDDSPSPLDYPNPIPRCSRENQVETSNHNRFKHQNQEQQLQSNRLDRSSDCTSIMSTDSVMSKRFCVSQTTMKANVRLCDHPRNDLSQKNQNSQSSEVTTGSHPQPPIPSPTVTFVEPSRYVAPIPVQSAAVTTQIPTADHLSLYHQGSTQMQMELQKKHAELQVVIRQQKAELRKVSEQLLMARLGIVQTPQTQSTLISTCNNGTVSSTTSPLIPISVSVADYQLIAASNVAESNDI